MICYDIYFADKELVRYEVTVRLDNANNHPTAVFGGNDWKHENLISWLEKLVSFDYKSIICY